VSITDLFGFLPDFDFVEKDPETIKNAIIADYEAAHSRATGEKITLYPGDPRRLFLLSVANTIILQRNLIDWVGKENLLAYASENRLDHLGVLLGVTRLPARHAHVTLRFTLSTARETTTVIPAGIRAAPSGGTIYFATAGALEIPPGELTGDVRAEALDYGSSANALLPGQINSLVDPLPYIQSAANVTASEGGADIEDDENFRERIRLAPESFSNAGSIGAYIFWARTASQLIVDVGVSSPEAGVVNIFPLLEGGEVPGQEILDAVLAVCDADTIRPMTDLVRVFPPQTVEFDLNVTWYLERSNAAKVIDISSKVNFAVRNWLSWQRSKLGRDINPSELIARMVQAGAKRVVVESPDFRVLEFNQVTAASGESVTYGGVEDG
jgi:phage-related baseplate assembly protein